MSSKSVFSILSVTLSALLSFSWGADLVPVVVDFEALCPSCQTFTTTTLKNTLQQSDIVAIIALKMVAYGKAQKLEDGTFSCQHGEEECWTNALEGCVQYKLSGDISSIDSGDTSLEAWPFVLCMEEAEGKFSEGESCFASTMNSTGLSWETVEECYNNEYNSVLNAAMEATDPNLNVLPWVVVDGELLEDTNQLTKAICEAYTGVPPTTCQRYIAGLDPI